MAKDKGAKPTKGKADAKPEKSKSKGGSDEFAKPSDAPSGGGNRWPVNKDNIGKLMLITPLREQTVPNPLGGKKSPTKQQIIADVVIIDEKKPAKSTVLEGAEMEGGWVLGALRGYIGERRVLGRLGQDAAKGQGDRAAWVLEDADDDDIALAKAYLDSVDPFDQPGAKAKKAKGGKGK